MQGAWVNTEKINVSINILVKLKPMKMIIQNIVYKTLVDNIKKIF